MVLHHMLTQIDVAGVPVSMWGAVGCRGAAKVNFGKLVLGAGSSGGDFGSLRNREALPQSELDKLLREEFPVSDANGCVGWSLRCLISVYHREYDPQQGGRVQQILDDVRPNRGAGAASI